MDVQRFTGHKRSLRKSESVPHDKESCVTDNRGVCIGL
jgi:hypothetical protein